jgi:hypothetical protein
MITIKELCSDPGYGIRDREISEMNREHRRNERRWAEEHQ